MKLVFAGAFARTAIRVLNARKVKRRLVSYEEFRRAGSVDKWLKDSTSTEEIKVARR